jgi:hypothetical protein
MTRVAALSRRLRRYLTRRLTQLNTALTDLTARLRSAAATRFADHVAAVVRVAVEEALAGPTASTYLPPRSAYHEPTSRWGDRSDPPRYIPSARAGPESPWPRPWADEEDERRLPPMRGSGLFARDPYESDEDDEADVDFEEADGNEPEATPVSVRSSPSTPRLHAALVLGLQASAWWLGRRRRTSLLMALAVGASAGTLVLFGGPLLDAGVDTLRALLSLTG